MGKQWKQWETLFFWAPKSLQMVTAAMKLRHLLLGRKAVTNLDSILKIRDITLPTKVHLVKAMVFPVVMYGCESWTIKKAEGRRIDAFELWFVEDSWESLGLQGVQPVHPKGSPVYSLEELMLWLPDAKNWFIWKDPDTGKDQRWEEKGTTEYEMVGWHHQLNGHGFE